jgi:hypothetical protein
MHVSLTYDRMKRDGSYLLIVREESQPVLKLQAVSQTIQPVEKPESRMVAGDLAKSETRLQAGSRRVTHAQRSAQGRGWRGFSTGWIVCETLQYDLKRGFYEQ